MTSYRRRAIHPEKLTILPTDPPWLAALKQYCDKYGGKEAAELIGCSNTTVYKLLDPALSFKVDPDTIYNIKAVLMGDPPQPPDTTDPMVLFQWYLENRSPQYIYTRLGIHSTTLYKLKREGKFSDAMSDRIYRVLGKGETLPPMSVREPLLHDTKITRCRCGGLSVNGLCRHGRNGQIRLSA